VAADALSHVLAVAASGRAVRRLRLDRPLRARLGQPGGEKIVVLNAKRYDRIMERIEDLEARAAYVRTRTEESFPVDVAERLVKGEHPVRVIRQYRGLTLDALATTIGRSKAYVSEIERRRKPGSIKVLRAIARALRVDIDDLL
jgi:DNA-binding XRE family transcriptional regulator